MSITFNIKAGKSLKLLTAGKYCDRDIVVNAVGGVGGGSSSHVARKDINFYDYDGTLLHSYTVAEAQALSELPELPTQDGLICQGWNFDLETIKAYNRAVDVGAMYITDDGKTRIYIRLKEGRTSPALGLFPNGTVTVDWGDGTEPDVLTGTSATANVKFTPIHNYSSAGDYVISLTVNGTFGFYGNGFRWTNSSSSDNRNYVYNNAVQKIEIGDSITSIRASAFSNYCSLSSINIPNSVTTIQGSAFYNCRSLSFITIPNGVTQIQASTFYECRSLSAIAIPDSVKSMNANEIFQNCSSLSSITIPNNITQIGNKMFYNCHALSSVILPDGLKTIGDSSFAYCHSLISVTIPNSVTTIGSNAFDTCYSLSSINIPDGITTITGIANRCQCLSSVIIPSSVTTIGANTFGYCYGVRYYDFSNHTSVPTLSAITGFSGLTSTTYDCEIRVPSALYSQWKSATNWATFANYIVAV